MEFYGLLLDTKVHSKRLKYRLLAHIPDLEAYKEGHDILLAFQKDIGTALKRICQTDEDEKAITLAKAAEIVREDMLNTKTVFSGKFELNCQEDSVPISLLYLVENILKGGSIQFSERYTKNLKPNSTASLSISQLLFFNCKGRRSTIATSI